MSKRLQTGGSKGEPVRSSSMPFFYSGVKAVELITKNVYGVRILPAFQRDEHANLPTSPVSFIPYRDAANLESGTSKPVFTDWYYSLKGYKFLGNEGRGFLSPLITEKVDHRGIDPLFDCFHLARNSKDTNPAWFNLTEKADGEKNATLEKYRVFCAFNCLMQVDNSPVNRLGVVTKTGIDDLKEQLDVLCSRADQPNDPDWPDFMLGDITSPYHGLWGTVQKGVFNKAGMEASLFSFSRAKDRLVNVSKYPVDPASSWGQEVLAARFDISDLEKVTRIASAEEILDFIVNDGFLPIELIREACSPFWDVPEPKGRRTSAPSAQTGAPPPQPATATAPAASVAPAPQAAPTAAPTTAPAAPTASSRQFWILMPGGQVSPQPMPESILRSMVNQHKQDFSVMLIGESVWKTASAFGITVPAAPTPPAAPPPPAATQAPPPPARPSAPPAAPRTIAPGAPPSGGVPTVPPPGGSVPPPPPARPAPVQPAAPRPAPAPQPPAAAPQPPAAAPQPPAPTATAPAATASALTQAEREELAALEAEWLNVVPTGTQMDGARVARFCELSDRASAVTARG